MTDDEVAGDKARWKLTALDMREAAYEALTLATRREISNKSPLNAGDVVMTAHAYTLNYADCIRIKKNELPERKIGQQEKNMWECTVDTVKVPKSGEYTVGTTDMYGEYDRTDLWNQVPWTEKPVCPETLNREWRDNEINIKLRIKNKHQGRNTETLQEPVYLPPSTCSLLLNYLDRCFDELKWTPGVEKDVPTYGFKELDDNEQKANI